MSPTQSMLHTPPEGNINNSNESNPIMFAKLAGRQEVRLKMKQSEGVSGPKVNSFPYVSLISTLIFELKSLRERYTIFSS